MADKFNKIEYNNKYNAENYERIALVVPRGKKERIKSYAKKNFDSINGFINKAIDRAMIVDDLYNYELKVINMDTCGKTDEPIKNGQCSGCEYYKGFELYNDLRCIKCAYYYSNEE